MAIYYFNAEPVQRSKGHTATGGAAYRSATLIHDERTGETHDFRRKSGVVQSGIIAPDNAPQWAYDRAALWNHAEFAEKRRDGQPAREIRLALPCELTDKQRADLVFSYAQDMFVSKGMVADIAIHRPGWRGDQRNEHAHILLTMRELDGDQFAVRKQRDWNRKEALEQWREEWANYQNRALEEAGGAARVDHRTLEAQGSLRQPTQHLGKDVTALERKGVRTERGDINREIEAQNRLIESLLHEMAVLDAQIQRKLESADLEPEIEALPFLAPQTEQPLELEPALSWEEEKARAQDPASFDVASVTLDPIAVYEPGNSFAFLTQEEPVPDKQPPPGREEEPFQAQDPLEGEITKEFVRQIRQYGEIQEYGLGKSWFDKTLVKFANLYYDTVEAVKDTWQEYVVNRYQARNKDSDRDIDSDR